jgi:hypothetical protein
MIARGFKVCKSDPCVYTKDNIVILIYVDDMLIFPGSMQQIENFMQSLHKEYDYADEGDISSKEVTLHKTYCDQVSSLLQQSRLRLDPDPMHQYQKQIADIFTKALPRVAFEQM